MKCAAKLLGGPAAARRCDRLVVDINESVGMTARIRRELDWLHGLLTLENVYDIESDEAFCFALIDPADACVEEICVLADLLRDEIDALPAPTHTAGNAATTNFARCA
nr:hypothetical protein [Pararhodobacter sp. SW119]